MENPETETNVNTSIASIPSSKPLKDIPLKKILPEGFLNELDPNFRRFCRGIRTNLRLQNYEIIAITGYPGTGKSQLASIMGCLIDEHYTFGKNINFIPTAVEVEKDYLKLPLYSFLHIDEASRSIHKYKWYEKTQQKLSTLYDTERENHCLCSVLIMPRFQNFTENFRNFFIKYWINIVCRGIAIIYKRDEDKDTKDPWNVDLNMKLKMKYWRNTRIFERSIPDIIRMEQKTKNYWFYFKIPEIPTEVWSIYQGLKEKSRVDMRESEKDIETENPRERARALKMERWKKIIDLTNEGKSNEYIATVLGLTSVTIRSNIKDIKAYQEYKGNDCELKPFIVDKIENSTSYSKITENKDNKLYNLGLNDKIIESPLQSNKVQNVKPNEEQWDTNGLIKKD